MNSGQSFGRTQRIDDFGDCSPNAHYACRRLRSSARYDKQRYGNKCAHHQISATSTASVIGRPPFEKGRLEAP